MGCTHVGTTYANATKDERRIKKYAPRRTFMQQGLGILIFKSFDHKFDLRLFIRTLEHS